MHVSFLSILGAMVSWGVVAAPGVKAADGEKAPSRPAAITSPKPASPAVRVQAGFYTPARVGKMWDTWIYYHGGKYYMYYQAGGCGHEMEQDLATSEDGVHWKEFGIMIEPRIGNSIGTGHIWKSPDFDKTHKWIMNHCENVGSNQSIMFTTSTDLLNWTNVDEKYRFRHDTRWYKPDPGRWDCIDTIERDGGGFYGYFTANPDDRKLNYRPCGFGFAESKDGIQWTALPPVQGDIDGEFGGIQRIGNKCYILIGEGRVAVGDKPEGPFYTQKKNCNAFGKGCDIYFPRFFHNAAAGPLVNHFYTRDPVYAAPLKDIEIDREGILRLKWWKNNDKLKANPVETKLVAAGAGYDPSLRLLGSKLDLSRTHVIEGTLSEAKTQPESGVKCGIYLDQGNGQGQCLLLGRNVVHFATIQADGSNLKVLQTSNRDVDLGPTLRFRLVMKADLMELYINDYLMNLNRVQCNGQIGFMGADNAYTFKDIEVWQSN